jgi:DNA-binding SARP family transcriptional activator
VNPRHYTDLLAFSLKEKKFIKQYDFVAPASDIDFAHSMVFNQANRSFYVLASSIYQYDSYLQILKGNLDNQELQFMGDKIPYLFHNENSYSDLFFARSLQRFIAVTSLADKDRNETEFKVYTIAYPPVPYTESRFSMKGQPGEMIWIGFFIVLGTVLLIFGIRWVRNSSLKGAAALEAHQVQTTSSTEVKPSGKEVGPPGDHSHMQADYPEGSDNKVVTGTAKRNRPNSVLFFGGFQVINRSGEDITRKFSPLLKELFLLIFLYSVKGKGISVPRLTEILWFPMDTKSAKNNRAVNIAKLKHLLDEIDTCELTRKTEYWQILFDDSKVYSDYYACHSLTNDKASVTANELEKLLRIIKAGPMLGNVGYEWLDEFKLDCSNQITDVLINYLEKENGAVEHDLVIRIADAILIFDIMHEEAISFKCRALTELGKHSLAKEIFTKFTRDYQSLYDEPYKKSFTDIIRNNI